VELYDVGFDISVLDIFVDIELSVDLVETAG